MFRTTVKRDKENVVKIQGARVTSDSNYSAGVLFQNYNDISGNTDDISSIMTISTTNSNVTGDKVDVSGDLLVFTKNADYDALRERIRIKGNGYIGINTFEPTERVHIDGNLRVDGDIICQQDKSDFVRVGTILPIASSISSPNISKYLLANGKEMDRQQFSLLFTTIGTNYGEGDGETTFNLPDIQPLSSLKKVVITDIYLYSSALDDGIKKINFDTLQVLDTYEDQVGKIFAMEMGVDGFLYAGGSENTVYKIDPFDMKTVGGYSCEASVQSICFDLGKYMFVGCNDGSIHKVGAELMKLESKYTSNTSICNTVTQESEGIIYAGFSDNVVEKIDTKLMKNIKTYTNHNGTINTVLWKSGYLFTGSSDNEVHKINSEDMTHIASYTGHAESVLSLAWNDVTDGVSQLFTGSKDNEIHQLDGDNMSMISIYPEHNGSINTLATYNGHIYSGGSDNALHKIDKVTFENIAKNNNFGGNVLNLQFTPSTIFVTQEIPYFIKYDEG